MPPSFGGPGAGTTPTSWGLQADDYRPGPIDGFLAKTRLDLIFRNPRY
jgi:hypothetical protein